MLTAIAWSSRLPRNMGRRERDVLTINFAADPDGAAFLLKPYSHVRNYWNSLDK